MTRWVGVRVSLGHTVQAWLVLREAFGPSLRFRAHRPPHATGFEHELQVPDRSLDEVLAVLAAGGVRVLESREWLKR